MRKLSVFESVSVNGYFTGPDGDLSWAHGSDPDPEFQDFVNGNARTPGVLVLGRITYQMMESYWPTPAAAQNNPVVARGMNEAEKVVFSRTLVHVSWRNSTLVRGDPVQAVRELKRQSGNDLVVLGSGSLVAQLAAARLVDEYLIVVKPVALGDGQPLFAGLRTPLPLTLASSRAFRDGTLLLRYAPAA